ncbi:CASC3/Barentsz eIF4AIII binding-domain-containing protein [Lophiotrema nucula]|uniref:CASC3/Barentsz eIF4AIII binding-domain-containing protein n=1 Tax=Lophiotrema nucula TaxID=690887 RepID=A0A6A5YTY2_9PLEO|nr:CASC3/Barentsz eIF4AIII binding-domain-containing protein [Lophiotrema nucula]
MAAPRKTKISLARRRRLDEEGDDVSVATELDNDSQSDMSGPSDVDADAELSDNDSAPSVSGAKGRRKANGAKGVKPVADSTNRRARSPPIVRSDSKFTASKDTDLMINGLKLSDEPADEEVVDFDTGAPVAASPGTQAGRNETLAERRRREHDEYKKKRDSDPAFIPNRGAFFMHDQRSAAGQNGFRGAMRGGRGGRGRGPVGGPYAPANIVGQAPDAAADAPWQHDLHETVAEPERQPPPNRPAQAVPTSAPVQHSSNGPQQPFRQPGAPAGKQPQARNFSTTVHTHNALARVFLPNMKSPILFQNVPIRQHTRLPNHRPPLRRDKPVRISLPPAPPRYIFPTIERSFIFIPRALRPNQQGFGRGRGRNFGSFGGGYSSRRTSAYGGSVYSPSVAMSRRSSMAREMGRDGLVSPAGSIMSHRGGFVDPSRPVVRLPPGAPKMPSGPAVISPQTGTPSGMPMQQSYPLPQKPTFRENWQGQLTMHQPRPQKAVSVAGIESPASMTFNPPQQQEQQPFHQQVPANLNGNGAPAEQPAFYPHARQLSYPSQASTGTPLSNIPERAIHAPAFQPYQQNGFQPQGYMPQPYYYPQNGPQPQFAPPAGMVPMFVPNQQSYVMPMAAPTSAAPTAPPTGGQPNMVAYESNGMTYYVDSAQLYASQPVEGYPQAASYAVPGMGGMMTPSPDGQYYYPQQMQPNGGVYYQPQ